jgi:hypothetical protein
MNRINCLVIVNGYTEGFGDKRGKFTQIFPIVPSVGDLILLEPGSNWGKIWCVVEHRVIYENSITLCTRLIKQEDQLKAWEYGEECG